MGVISNGTTLLDAGALDSGIATGNMVLLSTSTASSSATIDITSGIDSTYKEYQFHFINIHPATSSTLFTFQADTGTNTNYNQTITSSNFRAKHAEDDGGTGLEYRDARDQGQGSAFQHLSEGVENDNDSSLSGVLKLFEPSSSTFMKHFVSRCNGMIVNPGTQETFCAGYFNTTTALTRVQFKMSSGNIDSGVIKMYGIK